MSRNMKPLREVPLHELRPVPGFPGHYANSEGAIFLLREKTPKRDRYDQISFTDRGKTVWTTVHRMVCLAFHGPAPEGKEVAHGNGDPYDNRAENLRWATKEENAADRGIHGTAYRGDGHRWSRLTEEDVRDIRRRVGDGERQIDLATEYHMHRSAIAHIVSGRSWAHVK